MDYIKSIGLLLCLLLVACSSPPAPTSLSDARMSEIMAELLLCEGATIMINGYKRDSLAAVYYDEVFAKQRTSKQEYEENIRIMVGDIVRMEQIMVGAERILKEKQANLQVVE